MDGYLFFDDVTPATRDALFDLVEEELLQVAAVSVAGGAGAFVAYEAGDVRTGYATVEAAVDAVGPPGQRLLAVTPRVDLQVARPGHRTIAEDAAVALALLAVPISRAEDVAHLAVQVAGAEHIGVALVVGGTGTLLIEVDGADLEELQLRLAPVLAVAGVAGVADAEVFVTGGALGRGWGSGAADQHEHEQAGHEHSSNSRLTRQT